MSDLKPFNSERIYWAVEQVEREAGDIDDLHLDDNLFYLKSEADKVIADLEEKLKNSRNARKYWMKEYLLEHKECIHHKYKRCLAMARWCETQFAYYIASCDRYDSKYVNKKAGHFYKWKYKWLELAEKFKEAR
jgi:hypothetical protein